MNLIVINVAIGALIGVGGASVIAWALPANVDKLSRLAVGLVIAPVLAFFGALLMLFAMK